MPIAATRRDIYLRHSAAASARWQQEPAWLRDRRNRALERFLQLGVPSTRHEDYRYIDLSPVADGELLFRDPAPAAAVLPDYVPASQGARPIAEGLAVHGIVPGGAEVYPISELLRSEPGFLQDHLAAIAGYEDHALCALNTAFFSTGAVVRVRAGATVEHPIHLVFGAGTAARHPRVLVVAGPNSAVQVVESYAGGGAYWRNGVTEIHAAENARVDHYRAQLESPDAFHTSVLQAEQRRDSYVGSFSLSFGARLARNDIGARLGGTGGECSLDGLYTAGGRQVVDHHTSIDHAMPHCNSHQLYKGVLDGRAKGVFNGKIFVRQDAQKTNAIQNNKNLLLSDSAEINTKPQLEIDANDVRCTHGATIGQLDATALFYLRSRGIGAAQARNLLTYAFAADALERIRIPALKAHFEARLLATLAEGTA